MLTYQFVKKYYQELIAVIWAIVFIILALLKVDIPLIIINRCAYTVVCFLVTAKTLHITINSHDNEELLYGALGMSCLALGGLYFLVAMATSKLPATLCVGDLSSTCSFLFYIVILIKLKDSASEKHHKLLGYVNILTIIVILISIYTIIADAQMLNIVCEASLDLICISLCISLLGVKPFRFFSIVMLILSGSEILTLIIVNVGNAGQDVIFQIFLLITNSTLVLLYFLLAKATMSLKTYALPGKEGV